MTLAARAALAALMALAPMMAWAQDDAGTDDAATSQATADTTAGAAPAEGSDEGGPVPENTSVAETTGGGSGVEDAAAGPEDARDVRVTRRAVPVQPAPSEAEEEMSAEAPRTTPVVGAIDPRDASAAPQAEAARPRGPAPGVARGGRDRRRLAAARGRALALRGVHRGHRAGRDGAFRGGRPLPGSVGPFGGGLGHLGGRAPRGHPRPRWRRRPEGGRGRAVTEHLPSAAVILLAVMLVLRRLRAPTPVGHILTAIPLGPGGAGLLHESAAPDMLAEIGVAFPMFRVGPEFPPPVLVDARRAVFGVGGLRVALAAAPGAAAAPARGLRAPARGPRGRRGGDVLHRHRHPPGGRAGRARPGRAGRAPVPGPRHPALPGARGGVGQRDERRVGRARRPPPGRGPGLRGARPPAPGARRGPRRGAGIAGGVHPGRPPRPGRGVGRPRGGPFAAPGRLSRRHDPGRNALPPPSEEDVRRFRDVLLGLLVCVGLRVEGSAVLDVRPSVRADPAGLVALKGAVVLFAGRLTGEPAPTAPRAAATLVHGGESGPLIPTLAMDRGVLPPETVRPLLGGAAPSVIAAPLPIRADAAIARTLPPRPVPRRGGPDGPPPLSRPPARRRSGGSGRDRPRGEPGAGAWPSGSRRARSRGRGKRPAPRRPQAGAPSAEPGSNASEAPPSSVPRRPKRAATSGA